ncbi:hypothetical protein [Moorena sp. SIO4G3]|uniref:hypothetical protein n=1 Tax=Moorena sp. SIO4G3 TaxID=2607821 RepID=UPI00142A2A28|nr:hypothetical protein [Moorena sp. SIO4G3]NEO81788.1 hypothetical protein [Moorena sp. SIO4G3]
MDENCSAYYSAASLFPVPRSAVPCSLFPTPYSLIPRYTRRKAQKKGIWRSPNSTLPWEFRRGTRACFQTRRSP